MNKPTQPVDSKLHDSVGIKTVDGDLEHKMLMLFHRMSVCAAAHQDKDAEWIDGQCVTPSTATKEAVKLHTAHLQAAVSEAKLKSAIQTLMSLNIDTESSAGKVIDAEITRLRMKLDGKV